MALTEKQLTYIREANRRWNFKVGAVRSGKTYCDFFVIPMRIRAIEGDGLIVLMGNTVGTLCRNILDPMRAIWGEELVGNAGSWADTVTLFGRKCFLIGADKACAAEKLQGCSVAYCYGDEVTTWSEEVFGMLKSRLDKPYSRFDGTCNPSHPGHWLKRFLESGADLYVQYYTMEDNPFLPPSFTEAIRKEYAGTVWYDRLILGKWTAAEGVIYRKFAEESERFFLSWEQIGKKRITRIAVGVDFGGTRSATAFVAVGFTADCRDAIVLSSERIPDEIDAEALTGRFCDFLLALRCRFPLPVLAYCDNAEPVLIRTLKMGVRSLSLPVSVRPARKSQIRSRIRLTLRLMAQGRLFLSPDCASLAQAFREARWDGNTGGDERLDDGTSDVDSLDAFEYAIEHEAGRLTSLPMNLTNKGENNYGE